MPDDPNRPRAVAFPPTLIPHVLDYFDRINRPELSTGLNGLGGAQGQVALPQASPTYGLPQAVISGQAGTMQPGAAIPQSVLNQKPIPMHPLPAEQPASGPDFVAGNAPDPSVYAAKGEAIRGALNFGNPDGLGPWPGLAYNASQFQQNHSLDAQVYGADHNYSNYVFGVHNAATGMIPLESSLQMAEAYGKEKYGPRDLVGADPAYPDIPRQNVDSIRRGYSDYQNGTLWHKPK